MRDASPSRSPRLAAFVSPHGFGHAARVSAVLAALAERVPGLAIELYTTVPEWFFAESLAVPFTRHEVVCDVGLVQADALDEDPVATRAALARFWPFADDDVARLAAELHARGCSAVLADISPLGLAVGRAAALPTVLVENFTWDWIYRAYLDIEPGLAPFADAFAALFGGADLRCRAAPACGEAPGIAVGPIARRPRTTPAATRARLGVGASQPLVVVSLGGIPWRFADFDRWRAVDDTVFVVPGGAERERWQGPLRLLPHHTPVYHPDLVAAADVVVGKLGYSTVAEAVAAGARYLWLPRPRFRESPVLAAILEARVPTGAITRAELESGAWVAMLPALLARPKPAGLLATGADEVAARLAELLR